MAVETNSEISELWSELKILVDSLELDMTKIERGNYTAGVRTRKGLRLLRIRAKELSNLTMLKAKELKSAKHVS